MPAAIEERRRALDPLLARWQDLQTRELKALNARLRAANLPLVEIIR